MESVKDHGTAVGQLPPPPLPGGTDGINSLTDYKQSCRSDITPPCDDITALTDISGAAPLFFPRGVACDIKRRHEGFREDDSFSLRVPTGETSLALPAVMCSDSI